MYVCIYIHVRARATAAAESRTRISCCCRRPGSGRIHLHICYSAPACGPFQSTRCGGLGCHPCIRYRRPNSHGRRRRRGRHVAGTLRPAVRVLPLPAMTCASWFDVGCGHSRVSILYPRRARGRACARACVCDLFARGVPAARHREYWRSAKLHVGQRDGGSSMQWFLRVRRHDGRHRNRLDWSDCRLLSLASIADKLAIYMKLYWNYVDSLTFHSFIHSNFMMIESISGRLN